MNRPISSDFPFFLTINLATRGCLLTLNKPKIVIEKLTKNVIGAHIREIFGRFGDIRSIDLPMNRACKGTPCLRCNCFL